ncbi:DUF1801 domain-containing protein [Micromonospora sp. WMMD1120]|uniref:DUF1801 domain-containing protein n=1 Tax=Micromonospora sp. WMMD1120 TaxID=3016106 RepID=UPI002417A54A|nr:DUF1801 domain-containing protein [Micromonospora sp. WMMD1120]MDG4806111.1 DUF1801 domain-containing protein [Micromonospora sp. WMMD1120]
MRVDDYLVGLPDPLREIGERLTPIIAAALPEATGAMWHGHPVWGLGDRPGRRPVCLIKAYRSDITFGLWRGQEITDGSGRLRPAARTMAVVKLRAVADIDPAQIAGWLHAAAALEEA